MKGAIKMIYSKELENMCRVAKGVDHGPAPIPEEGKWVKAKEIKDPRGRQSLPKNIKLRMPCNCLPGVRLHEISWAVKRERAQTFS